jgi:hypothetical protein
MVIMFNATFNNSSVISWRSVLFVEEIRVHRKKNRPAASYSQTLSHYAVSRTPQHQLGIRTRNVSCYKHYIPISIHISKFRWAKKMKNKKFHIVETVEKSSKPRKIDTSNTHNDYSSISWLAGFQLHVYSVVYIIMRLYFAKKIISFQKVTDDVTMCLVH